MNMNRFAEFATEEKSLDGDKIRIDDVLNHELVINAYKVSNSKYPDSKHGNYVTLQVVDPNTDKQMVIFTGSQVIASQCEKYKCQMPFVATIKKINKYYTFT